MKFNSLPKRNENSGGAGGEGGRRQEGGMYAYALRLNSLHQTSK